MGDRRYRPHHGGGKNEKEGRNPAPQGAHTSAWKVKRDSRILILQADIRPPFL